MATLAEADLASIRDEVGDTPDDDTLYGYFDDLGHWILVALRVLRRRLAGMLGGGVASVSIPGAVGVSLKSDPKALQAQIDRLTARYQQETGELLPGGATSTRLRRCTPR